ncbi:MAG: Asp-tRNA(Asn)/Glu-tRNA(Gln) amidotransferase subunit GatC [Clostridia bacterium]|jgi:aspartyl-tRNA(Asn)/glutamyl-tRNA(Gln) amidotransferase subunit C|nr:Asp-tRNA(Asn)/Glu-tRNA(Gln) amidotransferase subunit GatC [Clostridia bacterium]
MAISKEEVMHIAKLASLNLSEEEIEKYTGDMKEILEFANMINNVNTEGTEETIASNKNSNVFRKDEVVNFENRELLLKNAPSQDEGMFRIPKVIN